MHRRLSKNKLPENTAMRVLPGCLVAILFSLAVALPAPVARVEAQPAPAAEPAEPLAPAPEQAAPTAEPAAPAAEPAAPVPALTGLAGALAHFIEDDFAETDTGITEVAASGDPRAITIIEAVQDGRLSYSAEQKKVFYKDKAGKLIDAVTGSPTQGAEPTTRRRPRQQSGAARARCRAGQPEFAGARSRQAVRVGASGVQIARAERAARARCGA